MVNSADKHGDPAVLVLGQVARDLVLAVHRLPHGGGSATAQQRTEILGGKGANQAVALAQLGAAAAVVGVVGSDAAGDVLLGQAQADGVDVAWVARRDATATALLVDLVVSDGTRRLIEHVPPGTLLTPGDVRAAVDAVRATDVLVLQLQQPADALLTALDLVGDRAVVVSDGSTTDDTLRACLLQRADVLRADEAEAADLVGHPLPDLDATVDAARRLVDAGPRVVSLASGPAGNVVAWDGGCVLVPLVELPPGLRDAAREGQTGPSEPTGAGDSFTVALALAVAAGKPGEQAAREASAAAALTAARLGGRPALRPRLVEAAAELAEVNRW